MRSRRPCLGGNSRQGEETGGIHYVGNTLLSVTCLSLSRYKKELDCLTWVRKGGKELKRKRKKRRREEACPKGLFASEKIQIYCLLDSVLCPWVCELKWLVKAEKHDLKLNFSLCSG